ncbi:response regulator [Chrysiogenes arsenatis]|uniref:response regulator n=1 Tax=Chrysiogenes arsenatis TaxID=309797 RepID=UPI00041FE313|nr:response regulator [Chrysiogenes arsenatis]
MSAILIADKSPSLRKLFELTFSDEYQLYFAGTEADILPLIKEHKPELFFLDAEFADSHDATEALVGEVKSASGIPVVLLKSDFSEVGDIDEVDRVVQKPFEAQDLIACYDELALQTGGGNDFAGLLDDMDGISVVDREVSDKISNLFQDDDDADTGELSADDFSGLLDEADAALEMPDEAAEEEADLLLDEGADEEISDDLLDSLDDIDGLDDLDIPEMPDTSLLDDDDAAEEVTESVDVANDDEFADIDFGDDDPAVEEEPETEIEAAAEEEPIASTTASSANDDIMDTISSFEELAMQDSGDYGDEPLPELNLSGPATIDQSLLDEYEIETTPAAPQAKPARHDEPEAEVADDEDFALARSASRDADFDFDDEAASGAPAPSRPAAAAQTFQFEPRIEINPQVHMSELELKVPDEFTPKVFFSEPKGPFTELRVVIDNEYLDEMVRNNLEDSLRTLVQEQIQEILPRVAREVVQEEIERLKKIRIDKL